MPYLSDLINDHKAIRNESNEWKIQINMHVNFISSKDTGETRTIYVWSDNEEIRLGNETDDIIKELFTSFFNNYQKEEIILRNGINKRATINPKNQGKKCFQYSITVALNHQNIKNHPERISNIKPFINQYDWEDIDFPA